MDELGGPKWFNHFPSAWAHAMNTPFQWTKQVASHLGGTRNPLVISWPAKIKDHGKVRSQFLHVIDLVPTIYQAVGITPPEMLDGIKQKPIEGHSFYPALFDGKAPASRETQYFELLVNRGLYHDGWMISSRSFSPWTSIRGQFDPLKAPWELYHVEQDFSQAMNLAEKNPQKVKELEAVFWQEAEKYQVLPLDWRAVERLNAEMQGRPKLAGNRKTFTFYPGQIALPDGASPPVLNKSFSVTADIDIPATGGDGMIYTHGGLTGGFGIYLKEGKANFVYNMLALDRYVITSEPLPAGKSTLEVDFKYLGQPGQFGKGASVTLTANGKKIGSGEIPKTIPLSISLGEGVDVGMDTGSTVDFNYKLPFKFTGKIDKVTVELK
jgi:arylsulfatase